MQQFGQVASWSIYGICDVFPEIWETILKQWLFVFFVIYATMKHTGLNKTTLINIPLTNVWLALLEVLVERKKTSTWEKGHSRCVWISYILGRKSAQNGPINLRNCDSDSWFGKPMPITIIIAHFEANEGSLLVFSLKKIAKSLMI